MNTTVRWNTREEAISDIQGMLDGGKNEDVLAASEQYLRKWELSEILSMLRGEAFIRLGEMEQAKTAVEQGLAVNSDDFELYFMLGQIYEAQDKLQAAQICSRYALFLSSAMEDKQFLSDYYASFLQQNPGMRPLKTTVILSPEANKAWRESCLELVGRYNPEDSFEVIFSGKSGYNSGLENSGDKTDILFLEENTYLLPHTLFLLQLASAVAEKAGIIAPTSCGVQGGTNSLKGAINQAKRDSWKNANPCAVCVLLGGPAYYIRREVLRACGWLDERYQNLGYQLADLGFKAIQQGYRLYQAQGALIESHSFTDFSASEGDQVIFQQRWRLKPSYSCYARRDILERIKPDVGKGMSVLEVGCACGATLLAFEERFPGTKLYGIELDEGPAQIAGCFADVRAGNIENMNLDYEAGSFDYIIFGDVLEHLYAPDKLLERVKPYLKKDGRIIASIPNVMHISVIKNLLEGHWTYEDAGILDRTHLRFFTYDAALALFRNAGYHVEDVGAINMPVSPDQEQLIRHLSSIGAAAPEFFRSYQYIIQSKRNEAYDAGK